MKKFIVLLSLLVVGFPESTLACDLCAIYTADHIEGGAQAGFSLSVGEQFTGFHRLQNDGKHVENEGKQSLTSSITQITPRYDFNDRVGLQLGVPLISRDFKRVENGVRESGSESGIGDMSVLALFTPYEMVSKELTLRWNFRIGIKMPTGDTDRLGEEAEEGDVMPASEESTEVADADSEHAHAAAVFHAGHEHETTIESGVHGHDLALGSGSWDYVFGTGYAAHFGRVFTDADVQLILRTEGDFDYRYQNDLVWDLGVGSYLMLSDICSLSLKANLSGEYKGMDVMNGNKASDTGVNSMFLGPELGYTQNGSTLVMLGLDIPVFVDNTDLQIVPDYRFRVGVSYRF